MRTFLDGLFRAMAVIAAIMVLSSTYESLGRVDGNRSAPLFAIGGWDAAGLVAKAAVVLAAAMAFVLAVIAMPSPRPHRRAAWANLGYLLGIAGLVAVVALTGLVSAMTQADGTFEWGAGIWLGFVGYAVGGAMCFVVARD